MNELIDGWKMDGGMLEDGWMNGLINDGWMNEI